MIVPSGYFFTQPNRLKCILYLFSVTHSVSPSPAVLYPPLQSNGVQIYLLEARIAQLPIPLSAMSYTPHISDMHTSPPLTYTYTFLSTLSFSIPASCSTSLVPYKAKRTFILTIPFFIRIHLVNIMSFSYFLYSLLCYTTNSLCKIPTNSNFTNL